MKCPSCGKTLWFRLRQCPYCRGPLPRPARRPWTVSLPCWIFLAAGLLSLLQVAHMDSSPANALWRETLQRHEPASYYLRYLQPILMIALALLMFCGRNWARWILVVWFGNSLFWHALRVKQAALPEAALFVLCAALLFLPRSGAFFRPPAPPAASPAHPS